MEVLTLTNSLRAYQIKELTKYSINRKIGRKKRAPYINASFQKIRDKFPNATLTIIGRGEIEEYIKSLANQLI